MWCLVGSSKIKFTLVFISVNSIWYPLNHIKMFLNCWNTYSNTFITGHFLIDFEFSAIKTCLFSAKVMNPQMPDIYYHQNNLFVHSNRINVQENRKIKVKFVLHVLHFFWLDSSPPVQQVLIDKLNFPHNFLISTWPQLIEHWNKILVYLYKNFYIETICNI